MMYFPEIFTEAVKPDAIAETEAGTYIGWFARDNHYNRSQDPEGQAIWRIRFIGTSVENGATVTRFKYPNGRDEYEHVWNNRESLTYEYKK